MLNYVAASTVFGSHSERATRYLHNDDTPEMRPAPKNENTNSQDSFLERLNNNERS